MWQLILITTALNSPIPPVAKVSMTGFQTEAQCEIAKKPMEAAADVYSRTTKGVMQFYICAAPKD